MPSNGLYYLLMHGWFTIFPPTEFWSRVPSGLAIGGAAAGVVVLGKHFSSRTVAVASGARLRDLASVDVGRHRSSTVCPFDDGRRVADGTARSAPRVVTTLGCGCLTGSSWRSRFCSTCIWCCCYLCTSLSSVYFSAGRTVVSTVRHYVGFGGLRCNAVYRRGHRPSASDQLDRTDRASERSKM